MIFDRPLIKSPSKAKYLKHQDGANIIIGGAHDAADICVPEMHISRWGGHGRKSTLLFRHADCDKVKKNQVRELRKNGILSLEWDLGRVKHVITQGSIKHEIVYLDKADIPADAVPYLIESDGLVFHKQNVLTPEEIAEGGFRPENIIDSFAVYGLVSGRYLKNGVEVENYQSGKFGHLYRSKWLAGNGAWIWVDQWIEGGILWVAVPWDFINANPGPWTLDPTFGTTTVGGSSRTIYGDRQYLQNYQYPMENGSATSLSVYCFAGSGESTLGIYNQDGTLLADTAGASNPASAAWLTIDLDSPVDIVAGAHYFFGFNRSVTITIYYDSVSPATTGFITATYASGTLTATVSATTNLDTLYSVYATYTEDSTVSQFRRPTGDGDINGTWAYSSGTTAWNLIDEELVDTDDYTQTPVAASAYHYFTIPAFGVPAGATVHSLRLYYRAYEFSSGTNNIRAALKVNGTLYGTTDAGVNPGTITGVNRFSYAFTTNPDTGSAWTVDDINGSGANPLQQIGVNSTDSNPAINLAQLYAVCSYTEAAGGGGTIPIFMNQYRRRWS